ncbi:DNA-3-methyladenine glycosylase [Jiulongibacter sediminis]|jgi:DNA-3-methyladenine glycosylase II|uniref:DNA-3-methyladenine glycosylase family protein n=1 Tax=Jiulongibacter sediminis TaxID=1605367 RepID=UPI0026EF0CD4|nr:DNA-3-methyladenine glycosylase [Jiulongibacter sediminis]
MTLKIDLPKDFNKELLFQYLRRSSDEISFSLEGESIFKLFFFATKAVLCKIDFNDRQISVDFLKSNPNTQEKEDIQKYIREWFDLDTNLSAFQEMAANDFILRPLLKQFPNLRIVKSPDLFEALSWSIIGQQINLTFAYQCKRRLIEYCNRSKKFEGKTYYAFPKPEQVFHIEDQVYTDLKFSRQKVRYLRTVSEAFTNNKLSKKELQSLSFTEAEARLTALKGIGKWSANYVLMRCLGFREAFPIADVGLHNALKKHLDLDHKPSISEIGEWAKNWKGWEAYATFYLWQSLL